MFVIENSFLSAYVLDPKKDRELLGSRYCHGGYIWKIIDKKIGSLLSGPMFPNENPDTFDGQGMPEVFETAPGYFPTQAGDNVMVIGVGNVVRTSNTEPFHVRYNREISECCEWTNTRTEDTLQMITNHSYKGYSYILKKTINLKKRTIWSNTEIENTGPNPLPIRWFSHPFFPLTADFSCCKLSLPVKIPENAGFYLNDKEIITMKENYKWNTGCYRSLQIPWGRQLSATIFHPQLEDVSIRYNFCPLWMPIWANANTFSLEAFLIKLLLPGEKETWDIHVNF